MKKLIILFALLSLSSCASVLWDESVYSYTTSDLLEPATFTFYNSGDESKVVTSRRMVRSVKNERYLIMVNDLALPGIDSATFIFHDQRFTPIDLYKVKDFGLHKGTVDLHYTKSVNRTTPQKVTKVSFNRFDDLVEELLIVTRLAGDTIMNIEGRKVFCVKLQTSVTMRYSRRDALTDAEIYDGPSVMVYSARGLGPVMYDINSSEKKERWVLRSITPAPGVLVSQNE